MLLNYTLNYWVLVSLLPFLPSFLPSIPANTVIHKVVTELFVGS